MSVSASTSKPAAQQPKRSAIQEATHTSQDWQTAYVWAFISKFHGNIVGKGGLTSVMDLEIALMASGEDDVLSYVFQKMVAALRDGAIRDMKKETMPRFLLRVIDQFLPLSPWSTYHDIPRHPSSEYTKVSTMTPSDAQAYHLGLNPLRALMSDDALEEGGGERPREGQKGWDDEAGRMLWRMDWKEKLRLLRQLVDWQLVHTAAIRQTIVECYNIAHQKPMNFSKLTNRLIVEPIAQDRTKKRFWSLDDSARMYTSSNPFKKVCPITPISSSKDELLALTAELREANDYYPPPPVEGSAEAPVDLVESAGKKKVKAEKKDKNSKQHDGEVKIIRFIEEEHLPRVEKEIIRQEAARKKATKVALLQAQADNFATRTTRTRKAVDYKALDNGTAYGGGSFSDDDRTNGDSDDGYSQAESAGSGRRRSGRASAVSSRATGSRRSTRVQMRDEEDDMLAALEQSAREAEMDRAMRGVSASASGDDDNEDGIEDDEEIIGALKPKMAIVIESDDEDDDDNDGGPAPMAVDGPAKTNGSLTTDRPAAAAAASTPGNPSNGIATAEAGAMDVDQAAP